MWIRHSFHFAMAILAEPLVLRRVHPGNVSADFAKDATMWLRILDNVVRDHPEFAARHTTVMRRTRAKQHLRIGRDALAKSRDDRTRRRGRATSPPRDRPPLAPLLPRVGLPRLELRRPPHLRRLPRPRDEIAARPGLGLPVRHPASPEPAHRVVSNKEALAPFPVDLELRVGREEVNDCRQRTLDALTPEHRERIDHPVLAQQVALFGDERGVRSRAPAARARGCDRCRGSP